MRLLVVVVVGQSIHFGKSTVAIAPAPAAVLFLFLSPLFEVASSTFFGGVRRWCVRPAGIHPRAEKGKKERERMNERMTESASLFHQFLSLSDSLSNIDPFICGFTVTARRTLW